MESLVRLYLPGALTLWCALAFGLASLWGYSMVLRGAPGAADTEASRLFARRAYRFFACSILLCALVMMLLLARRDFRIEYVEQYSGLDLPWYFQLAAFWLYPCCISVVSFGGVGAGGSPPNSPPRKFIGFPQA